MSRVVLCGIFFLVRYFTLFWGSKIQNGKEISFTWFYWACGCVPSTKDFKSLLVPTSYPVPSSEKRWVAANLEWRKYTASDCGSEPVVQLRGIRRPVRQSLILSSHVPLGRRRDLLPWTLPSRIIVPRLLYMPKVSKVSMPKVAQLPSLDKIVISRSFGCISSIVWIYVSFCLTIIHA